MVLKPAVAKIVHVNKYMVGTHVQCMMKIEEREVTIEVDYRHLENYAKTDLVVYFSFKNEHPSQDDHEGVIRGL